MTDKTKAQRVAEFRAKVDSAINQMCDPTSPNFARSAVEIRAGMDVIRDRAIEFVSALPDDPPGDAGLLRELRAWIVKQAGNMSPSNDDQWSRAAVQVTQAILGEIDRLLAAAPADKPAETAPEPVDDFDTALAKARAKAQARPDAGTTADERERRVVEDLADLEHRQWMAWATTLMENESLSAARADRWKGCMVPYSDLTEEMKEHDRKWAREALDIVAAHVMVSTMSDDESVSPGERERRIARWERESDKLVKAGAGSDYKRKMVAEALALMRTAPAPDSDATRRAERAEAEVARLRKECDEIGSAFSQSEAQREAIQAELEQSSAQPVCLGCGNVGDAVLIRYEAGDCDMECKECGSKDFADSMGEACSTLAIELDTAKAEVARLRGELDAINAVRDTEAQEVAKLQDEVRRQHGIVLECAQAAGIWTLNDTISPEIAATFPEAIRAENERLTKQIATMDSARLVEQGLAVSAEKRVTHLEGEVERLTKERDAGWAALERLREKLVDGLHWKWMPRDVNAVLNAALNEADNALASRPAQGKEAGRG